MARHSDPKLTAAVYGRSGQANLAAVVNQLPTGTKLLEAHPTCTPLAQTPDTDCDFVREGEGRQVPEQTDDLKAQTLVYEAVGSDYRDVMGAEGNSSGRIRTYDPPVNSRLLDAANAWISRKIIQLMDDMSQNMAHQEQVLRVLRSWATLPDAIRAAVLALVDSLRLP